MSVTKVINVEVQSGDINQLNSDLNKLDKNFKKVDNNVQKTSSSLDDVRKNGGAIAVLDELTGGLATKTRDVAEATELFNFKLKGTRTALIATGIGAFLVALGAVVAYWDEIVDFINDANGALDRQIANLERQVTLTDKQLGALNAEKKLLELQGKSTDKLIEQEKVLLDLKLQSLEAQLLATEARLKAEESAVREVTFFEKAKTGVLGALGFRDRATQAAADAVAGSQEERQQIADTLGQLEELKASIAQTKLSIFQLENPNIGSPTDRAGVQREQVSTVSGELSSSQLAEIENAQITSDALLEITKKRADQERVIETALSQVKVDIAKNTLSLLASVVEEGSAIGKGVAVAQATISGIEGVQNAFTTAAKSPITTVFPAYPTIQAGLAAAFSAIQIKKILSTDPTGKTAPNLGGGSSGLGGASAPSFNVVGTSGVNQLAESLQQDQQPVQAFVVGSNVTSQQALDRNITETATLG